MDEEGSLELRIGNYVEFVTGNPEMQLSSVPKYIHGFRWRIVIKPSGEPDFRLIVLEYDGDDDIPDSSCQANVTYRLFSQFASYNDEIYKSIRNFSKENESETLAKWFCHKVLKMHNHGFLKDNTVVIQVDVKVEVEPGVRIVNLISKFGSSISNPPDGVLLVGNNRIPIHKMYLSFYSEYFKTMFRSEFKEGHENEIVLEDVDYGEMIELLAVIYPLSETITDRNLKYILKLADRFIMPVVLKRCKKQLRISTLNDAQKLFLAQVYNFEDLQMYFAQHCKSIEDAKKLKSETEYHHLDHKTRSLLFDSIAS